MELKNILIVEDDYMVSEVLKEIVEAIGFRPFVAQSGKEALSLAAEHTFSLVILDIELPTMNGIEVARHLHEINENTPVLFSTGYSEHEDLINQRAENIYGVIRKPFDLREIKAAIENVMTRN